MALLTLSIWSVEMANVFQNTTSLIKTAMDKTMCFSKFKKDSFHCHVIAFYKVYVDTVTVRF